MIDLSGKVALVSGGARGMGAAISARLVEAGASVVLGDILVDEGKQTADELGERAEFVELDVTSKEAWTAAVARCEDGFGSLDVLVNNAGILTFGKVADMPEDEYRKLVDVNQVGVFLGMQAATPALIRAGGGSIVNISSVEGLGGGALLTGYSATKFAVRGMTKAAALELGRKNIRVNSVHPGAIRTDMVLAMTGGAEAAETWMAGKTALNRMGEPDDVAKVVTFLASDLASYVTGAELTVDGGVTASSGFKE